MAFDGEGKLKAVRIHGVLSAGAAEDLASQDGLLLKQGACQVIPCPSSPPLRKEGIPSHENMHFIMLCHCECTSAHAVLSPFTSLAAAALLPSNVRGFGHGLGSNDIPSNVQIATHEACSRALLCSLKSHLSQGSWYGTEGPEQHEGVT